MNGGALQWACGLLIAAVLAACGRPAPAPAVSPPRYPDYVMPALASPDPKQADFVKQHEAGWRWFQSGDLTRAEHEFQAVLKRSPQFYPTQTAMGYLELVRQNYGPALEHFDRVLQSHGEYVPALVGRGEALLAQSRDTDALATFEAALKVDPQLVEIGRRVEVLRARAAQENVAAARRAAQENRLDEAAQLYQKAIAASPQSAFLLRDLAEVEARQGKAEDALGHYRKAIELEPSDAASRTRIGEILDARSDLNGALAMYTEANGLEPSAELRRRIAALEARLAYLKLPAEYRSISERSEISRGDLASLIGIRLEPVLATAAIRPVVITDILDHWASNWIMGAAQAGVMEPYENHTFQPRNPIQRSDLAQAVARVLKLIAGRDPSLLKRWQSRQQKMADVGVSNLHYADVSLSVAAGVLPLTESGAFQLTRSVSGAEAIDAISRLEQLDASTK